MSKYRRWSAGDKFRPSASQANSWTDAAIAMEKRPFLTPPGKGEGRSFFRLVKTIGEHPIGATQPCKVMTGPKGAETESDIEIDCYNRFGTLPDGTLCISAPVINGEELIAAMCPPSDDEETDE